MKKKYILIKKDLLDPQVCFYKQLIINEENYVVVNSINFLAIKDCIPGTQLDVLGYFDEKGDPIAFFFNLFPDVQNGFFRLGEVIPDLVYLNVVSIGELMTTRKLKNSDYIYFFKNRCLFKIKFLNLIKYFSSVTKCGDITVNQPTYYVPIGIDPNEEMIALEEILASRKKLLEQLLKSTTKSCYNFHNLKKKKQMEVITFQAVDVPELHTLNNGEIYFLVESQFTNSRGSTDALPFKISLSDLLRNIYRNNLFDLINPSIETQSLLRSNQARSNSDSQINYLLNKLGG